MSDYFGSGGGVRATFAALVCGLAFATPHAFAQDEPAEDTAGRLDVVVVTAQRRSQSLQRVPVTVTTFGAEEIKAAQIQQIEDIISRTPGLSFDAFPSSQARLFIRGIGSSDRGASGDPSAAVFLDDIYIGRPAAIAFDAFDVERIEVLKGPQGTLYGRNVVGGAINIITKRPELDDFDASASLTYGSLDRLDGAGFLNIPFANNTSAIRISGSYRSHGGYVPNAFLNQDVEDQDTRSLRLQYYSEPTDDLRMVFAVDGTRDRATGPANHILERVADHQFFDFYTPNFDPAVTYGSDVGHQDRDTYSVRGEVSNDFAFGTLTMLASYRDLDYSVHYDFDGGNPDPSSPGFNFIGIAGGNEETAEMVSQEIRLSAPLDSPVNWVVGAYHYTQEVERSDILILDLGSPVYEEFVANASLDSIAFFGDVTAPITDRFSVFGGLRYSRDDKTQRARNTDSDAPLRAEEFFDETASVDFDDWTYRAGIQFQATPDDLLYATISRGFKSGGLEDTPADAEHAVTPFEPETALQYEIGQKSTFMNGSLIWNNTLYYMDYSDLQTGQTVDGVSITSNAGKATVQGYETQFTISPFDGFEFSLAYALTDATFDEFSEGDVDYAGSRISRTPEHKLTMSPSYTYSLPNGGDLTFVVDYRYASEIFDDNSNLPPEIRDPTHFVDARVSVDNLGNGISVSLWGKNLSDERTRTFQGGFLGANFGAFSPPRTYGVTLSWDY